MLSSAVAYSDPRVGNFFSRRVICRKMRSFVVPDYWMNRIQYLKQLPILGPHRFSTENISEKQKRRSSACFTVGVYISVSAGGPHKMVSAGRMLLMAALTVL